MHVLATKTKLGRWSACASIQVEDVKYMLHISRGGVHPTFYTSHATLPPIKWSSTLMTLEQCRATVRKCVQRTDMLWWVPGGLD